MKRVLMALVVSVLFSFSMTGQNNRNFHSQRVRTNAAQYLADDIDLIKGLEQTRNGEVYFKDVYKSDYDSLVSAVEKENELFSNLRKAALKSSKWWNKFFPKKRSEIYGEKCKALYALNDFYTNEVGPLLKKIKADFEDFENWKKWGQTSGSR